MRQYGQAGGGDGGNRTPVRKSLRTSSFTSIDGSKGSCAWRETIKESASSSSQSPHQDRTVKGSKPSRGWRRGILEGEESSIGSISRELREDRSSGRDAERLRERILGASEHVGTCRVSVGLRAHRHVRLADRTKGYRQSVSSPCRAFGVNEAYSAP